uniref:Sodium-dependent glucose transporter 1 n=2 Tax=Parasteatoda tepidariorum TaxID=114398 RepID=A0A2L2Y873_PARTP
MISLSTRHARIIKTFNLYACFIVLGLCAAITGPTLIDLTRIVNTDIATIAFIYTGRSCGYIGGSFIGGIIFDMFSKKQLILTTGQLITSITMIGVPWSRDIKTLTIWMIVNGFTLGALDTGANVCCLNLWGKDSGPYFQALHFMFGFGGLIAPLVAAPFLGDYSEYDEMKSNMTLTANDSDYPIPTEAMFLNASSITSAEIPRVTYAYICIGAISFLVSLLFFVMSIISPIDESGRKPEETESGNRSFGFTAIIVTLTSILVTTAMGTEVGYAQMLTTYAVKGPLHLTPTTGSYMTSTYWAAFTVTRFAAIFLSVKFSHLTILVFDVIVTFLGGLVLLIFATHYDWALWVASIFLGVGIASFFPASVSWIEKYINITNKIASTFPIVASFGEMLIPYAINYFIETKPKVFIYVVIGSCALAIIVTFFMYLILRNAPGKYTIKRRVVYVSKESHI